MQLNFSMLGTAIFSSTLLFTSFNVQATLLTFDGYSSIGTTSATSYGDRVIAAGAGVTLEGGATPNVVLNFVPLVSTQPNFEVYTSGYSGLLSALGDNAFNVPGYVELIADAGWDVVLESFQLGAWSTGSYPNSQVRIADTLGNTYFDSGLFIFPGGTVYTYPSTPIRSSGALRVYISDFGDLGLDNFKFSQAATVPESETYAMLLAGLGIFGFALRTRKHS